MGADQRRRTGVDSAGGERPGRVASRGSNLRPPGNRAAAGAKIRVFEPGTKKLLAYEQVAIYDSQAANSYYSYAITERHYGLGKRDTVDVSVEFYPSGKTVDQKGVKANTTVDVKEE